MTPAENVSIVGEQCRILVHECTGTAVGLGSFGETLHDLVGTGEHDPALAVIGILPEFFDQTGDHFRDLLRRQPCLPL